MDGEVLLLPIEYIVALIVMSTEAIKRLFKRRFGGDLDPAIPIVTALTLGLILQLANAYFFGTVWEPLTIKMAAREGLLAAGAAMGLWSGGKAYIEARIGSANDGTK